MIDRINLILKAKNITARQFADEIGIQPSGMSHILGGRNNPSLEFVNKVMRRYPEIDANWLLLGKGSMYGETAVPAAAAAKPVQEPQEDVRQTSLFFNEEVLPTEPLPQAAAVEKTPTPHPAAEHKVEEEPAAYQRPKEERSREAAPMSTVPQQTPVRPYPSEEEMQMPTHKVSEYTPTYFAVPPQSEPSPKQSAARRMVRLIMVFDDGTFEEATPAR